MKKLLILFILCFLPCKGNAIECEEPLVCVKMESQVCREQNLIHLGDDECVECKCPPEKIYEEDGEEKCCETNVATDSSGVKVCCKAGSITENGKLVCCPEKNSHAVEKNGKQACCGTGDYEGFGITKSGSTSMNIPVCGCPMKGKPTQVENDLICCGTGSLDGYEYDYMSSSYIRNGKCGCPKVDGKIGALGTDKATCCLNKKAYNSTTNKYDWVSAVCGDCPEENGKKGEPGTNKRTCCLNKKPYNSITKKYEGVSPVCGCPEENGKEGMSGTDGMTCCLGGKAYDSSTGLYKQKSDFCLCPKDIRSLWGTGEFASDGTTCCLRGKAYDSSTRLYTKTESVCNCPTDNNGQIGTQGTDGTTCCYKGKAYNASTKLYELEKSVCPACPIVEGKTGSLGKDGKTCCLAGKAYNPDSADYDEDSPQCCTLEQALAKLCCRIGILTEVKGKKECCNSIPECDPKDGVLIRSGVECKCGCETDDDCNTDVKWYEILSRNKQERMCFEGKCITKNKCLQAGQLELIIDYDDNGRITTDSLKPLMEKLKDELQMAPTDKVTIVLTSMDCNTLGFVRKGDKEKIYINSVQCCPTDNPEIWTCNGTIVHENDHRQDNYKQPLWGELKTKLSKAYQDILTEITAHAKGDLENLVNYYKTCYPERLQGDDICALEPTSKDCAICAKWSIPSYAKQYYDGWYAQKYYSDPNYFKPNCGDLHRQLEKDFIESQFARSVYIEGKGQAMQNACSLTMGKIDTEEDLQKDVDKILNYLACKEGKDPSQINRSGITDLAALLAELYGKNNKLCMSPQEFASCKNMNLGLSGIHTCEVMHDWLSANPDKDPSELPETCEKCQEETYEIKEEE